MPLHRYVKDREIGGINCFHVRVQTCVRQGSRIDSQSVYFYGPVCDIPREDALEQANRKALHYKNRHKQLREAMDRRKKHRKKHRKLSREKSVLHYKKHRSLLREERHKLSREKRANRRGVMASFFTCKGQPTAFDVVTIRRNEQPTSIVIRVSKKLNKTLYKRTLNLPDKYDSELLVFDKLFNEQFKFLCDAMGLCESNLHVQVAKGLLRTILADRYQTASSHGVKRPKKPTPKRSKKGDVKKPTPKGSKNGDIYKTIPKPSGELRNSYVSERVFHGCYYFHLSIQTIVSGIARKFEKYYPFDPSNPKDRTAKLEEANRKADHLQKRHLLLRTLLDRRVGVCHQFFTCAGKPKCLDVVWRHASGRYATKNKRKDGRVLVLVAQKVDQGRTLKRKRSLPTTHCDLQVFDEAFHLLFSFLCEFVELSEQSIHAQVVKAVYYSILTERYKEATLK